MSFNLSKSWTDPAVSVAAAGVGFLVGGPLGAALGGWHGAVLAGVLGECGKKLAETCTEKFGAEAVTKMFSIGSGSLADELKEPSNGLEQVYRKALHHSLKEVHSRLAPDFDDWFANWDICLVFAGALNISPIHPDQLTAEDLDPLFQRTMEQLDAQGSAISKKSISLKQERRTIPDALLTKLTELLPERFQKWFHDFVHRPEYEKAWKEKQQQFQDSVTSLLASIKSDTSQLITGQGTLLIGQADQDKKLDDILRSNAAILEFFRKERANAEEDGRLSAAEARALKAEAEDWKKKYLKLMKSDPPLEKLLSTGDFEAAALQKTQQIETQSSGLAQNYFELGTIHELRFDWQKALAAYREAWRLNCNWEYSSRYAESARRQNQFSEAIAVYEALRVSHISLDELANTSNNLAILYCETQRLQEAEGALHESLSTYRKLAQDNPEAYLPDIAMALNNLAILYRDQQRMQKAEEMYLESLAIYRKFARDNPEAHLADVARTLNNLANLYRATQRMEDAEEAYSESLSIRRELAQDNSEVHLSDVAVTLNSLAGFYRATQRREKAEKACSEALSIRRKLAQDNPEAYLPAVAMTLNTLAILYRAAQQYKDAEDTYREALSIRRKLAQDNPEVYLPGVASTLNNLANLYRATERMQEAEDVYREALSMRRKLAEGNPEVHFPDVAATLNGLTNVYVATQRVEEATAHCREAEKLLKPFCVRTPIVHDDLMSKILANQRRLDQGLSHEISD